LWRVSVVDYVNDLRYRSLPTYHRKQCVQSFNVFDFLQEIVRQVPDLSASTASADGHPIVKRRFALIELLCFSGSFIVISDFYKLS